MKYLIPGYKTLMIENVVMYFNGTISVDGRMRESVKQRIVQLAERYKVYVLTSDTQGTAAKELANLPVTLKIYNTEHAGECKKTFVEGLGSDTCACVGNGNNDVIMFKAAALSIAVLEEEGLFAPLLTASDILIKSSEDALDLLLDEKRIISGLRG